MYHPSRHSPPHRSRNPPPGFDSSISDSQGVLTETVNECIVQLVAAKVHNL